MKKILISATVASIALLSSAQSVDEMNKTIYMPVEFEPSLLSISRQNIYPSLLSPDIDVSALSIADFSSPVAPASYVTTLSAPTVADRTGLSPYRGYAALGYMPVFNLGASAGYRFIDNNRTTLGAWLQYDGNSFKSNTPLMPDMRLTRNTLDLDLRFAHAFRSAGRLSVDAGFNLDAFNRPWQHQDSSITALQYRIGADWAARRSGFAYFVGARFDAFSYNHADYALPVFGFTPDPYVAPTEMRYRAHAGAAYYFSRQSSINVHVDADFLNYNRFQTLADLTTSYLAAQAPAETASKTLGVVSVDPSFRFRNKLFNAKIGLRVQFTSNSGKSFHVAPDVTFAVTPDPIFSAYVKLGGGEHINNYASLTGYTPYGSTSVAYNNSHLPFTGELGLTVGPYRGLSITAAFGYAKANDWLMPVVVDAPYTGYDYFFAPVNLSAWHARVGVDYRLSSRFSARAEARFAPGSEQHAFYLERDRAKTVIEVGATGSPIDRLEIEASFAMRMGRSALGRSLGNGFMGQALLDLDNLNSLNVGASYRLTDAFTVFARFENILNNRAGNLPYLQGQGFKGLFGVALKF